MNLIIDVGNTRTKLAVFKNTKLQETVLSAHTETNASIKLLLQKYGIKNAIIASVGGTEVVDSKLFKSMARLIALDRTTETPFKNRYKTPETLGVDRIALVSAAANHYPKKNVLIIDAGTCITYDVLNKRNEYLGGAISPGIQIRFKALHDYTANLPLLTVDTFALTGKSTNEAIRSGVLNGVVQEIEGVISQYKAKYSTLTVVLTGGDSKFLARKLKSVIFANPNFLLEGLNSILIYNTDG